MLMSVMPPRCITTPGADAGAAVNAVAESAVATVSEIITEEKDVRE